VSTLADFPPSSICDPNPYLRGLQSPIGYEAAGVIEAVAEGVTEFLVGDRVSTILAFKMSKYGVYGETVIVPVHAVRDNEFRWRSI
jgi:NADPH:quinone reductase-like Zn-dependent oxidoreductase